MHMSRQRKKKLEKSRHSKSTVFFSPSQQFFSNLDPDLEDNLINEDNVVEEEMQKKEELKYSRKPITTPRLGGELIKYLTRYVVIVVFLQNGAILKNFTKGCPRAWDFLDFERSFLDSTRFSKAFPPSANLAMMPTSAKLAGGDPASPGSGSIVISGDVFASGHPPCVRRRRVYSPHGCTRQLP